MTKTPDNLVNYGDLPHHLGFNIRRAHTAYERIFTSIVGKKFSLKGQQYSILELTNNNHGITPSEIADAIEAKRSLITVLAEDLRKRGYLEIKSGNKDKRRKQFFLTPAGVTFLQQVRGVLKKEFGPALAKNLSQQEEKNLIRLLLKIYT